MQNQIKHTYRRISRDSFRIAIQLPSPYPGKPLKVWRIRSENGCHSFCLEGLVLADIKNGGPAVVAHVSAGDVVMVTHHPENSVTPPHRGFLISEALVPVPMDNLAPFFQNQTILTGPLIDYDGHRFLHFLEDDIREFFRATHPEWLRDHVDATLRLWRMEAPDLFTRIAPERWLTRKLWCLAIMNPRKALEEHPQNLGRDLRRFCIRRLVPNKNRSLNRLLPSTLKSLNHYQNASYLLKHHLPELDDTQLRICAFVNPTAALARYSQVPDFRRRALLLSCAFRHAWPNRVLMRDPAFHQDIIDSLTIFSVEWTISNPEGLVDVLRLISDRIPFHPTPTELIRMMEQMDPHSRQGVADFISSRV
jgi:hypothetical protein